MVAGQGFDMYVAQEIEAAKVYAVERYAGNLEKRYGLLASSKAKNLEPYGVRNGYNFTKNLREGPWYNDAPDSRYSCCQLQDVATEFACQGLELDFPIVAWGNDLTWAGDRWVSPSQPRSQARNPHTLRLNSYRVLLTRGRDGFVVFVPRELAMQTTYEALRAQLVLCCLVYAYAFECAREVAVRGIVRLTERIVERIAAAMAASFASQGLLAIVPLVAIPAKAAMNYGALQIFGLVAFRFFCPSYRRCPACGTMHPKSVRFCSRCGRRLDDLGGAPALA